MGTIELVAWCVGAGVVYVAGVGVSCALLDRNGDWDKDGGFMLLLAALWPVLLAIGTPFIAGYRLTSSLRPAELPEAKVRREEALSKVGKIEE